MTAKTARLSQPGRLDPILARARHAVRETLTPLIDDEKTSDALVLVACSGGPDSLALAAATAFVAPRLGLRAGAVIVDHGLQEGSAQAAQQAAQQCRDLGLDPITVRTTTVNLDPGSGGLEGAARDARYQELSNVQRETGAIAMLLGHTLDDQAEQVLLSIARGSGARSLAGIPARRGTYVRPFLEMRRTEIDHICAHLNLTVWHDPTNFLPKGSTADDLQAAPRRTVVRDLILPELEKYLGPGIATSLARTAQLARDDDEALRQQAQALLQQATSEHGDKHLTLDCAALQNSPKAVRTRALHQGGLSIGIPSGYLAFEHIAALDALVTQWRGQGPVDLPGRYRGQRRCGTLTLYVAE